MASGKRSVLFARGPISRRDVLRAGSALLPAGILLPAWLRAGAATTATFDYYISTTGSSSNPGTLASPWDIGCLNTKSGTYAGRRVGLIAGTYDVSSLNANTILSFNTPLFAIPSGTSASSPTYIGSCDTSGNYTQGAAWIQAKTPGGTYTGTDNQTTPPQPTPPGSVPREGGILGNTNSSCQYITIDGLRLSGVRSTPLAFGQGPGTGYQNVGIVVQNCELFDCSDILYGTAAGNYASVQFFNCTGALFQNNYVHNCAAFSANSSANTGHLSAALTWCCKDTLLQYNTCIETGGFYGKEGGTQGTIIRYNYVQHLGNAGGEGVVNCTGYAAGGMTGTTQIYNNIFYTNADGFRLVPNLAYNAGQGWSTPLHIYNNTVIWTSPYVTGLEMFAQPGTSAVGGFQFYNNIMAGPAQTNEGTTTLNFAAPGVVGYNLYQTATQRWYLTSDSSGSSASPVATATSLSAAQSAYRAGGGPGTFEQNTVISSQTIAQLFTQSGTNAARFTLAAGSNAIGAGKSNGTSGGTAVDIGAWGNGATQIGCNFSSVATAPVVPDAPKLSVS
jgi:hypothetical protein